MTRIVILSGFRIFPAGNGAQVRTSGIARALARMGYEVLIYSLAGRAEDYRHRGAGYRVDEIEAGLTEETHLGLGFGIVQTVARRLNHPRYLQYWMLRAGMVPRRCAEALDEADAVVCDMTFVPVIRGRWNSKPWFLLSHNLESKLLEQEAPVRRRFAGWMHRVEAQAANRYREIFAVAEEDQAFFRAHDRSGKLAVPIITCAVDSRAYQAPVDARSKIRAQLQLGDEDWIIVFSGSAFGPNLEALERVRRIAREHSEFLALHRVYFLILGSMAPVASREGALICTGRVPEVVPYLAAADAGLNPITQGSGSNVKLFEYLATGLPVISTRFGVRGTPLEAGRDYLELDPLDFRGAIEQLVQVKDRRIWAQFAKDVWQRHRAHCDIGEVVRRVIRDTAQFPPPDGAPLREGQTSGV